MSISHHGPSQSISSGTSSSLAAQKPPVILPPSSHLDPNAYVRGVHSITLGQNVLVHPRVQLLSVHGTLTIGDECSIGEKAVVGGPVPGSSTNLTPGAAAGSSGAAAGPRESMTPAESNVVRISLHRLLSDRSNSISAASESPQLPPAETTPQARSESQKSTSPAQPTKLHSNVTIQPYALINAGATILSYSTVESHSIIHAGVTIGRHVKICAGSVVDRNVPDWTIVFADGRRRVRKPYQTRPSPTATMTTTPPPQSESSDERAKIEKHELSPGHSLERIENLRVRIQSTERQGTITIFNASAVRAAAGAAARKR